MTQEVGDLGTHELLTGPPVMTPHPFMKLCRLWTRYATKCSGSDHHTHRLRLPAAHYSTAQALTMATLMPLVKWLAPPGTRPCKMASSLPLSVVGDDSILTLGVPGREQNSHNIHMSTCTHAHVQNLWRRVVMHEGLHGRQTTPTPCHQSSGRPQCSLGGPAACTRTRD